MRLMPEQLNTLEKYAHYLANDLNLKRKTIENKVYLLKSLYALHGGEILWIPEYNTIHGLILRAAEKGVRKPWDRNTTYKAFTYMKDFYWWAKHRAQIIPHNPMAEGFKYRKGPKKEPTVIRKELWQRLWASPFMTVRDVAIMILFEASGIRKTELTSLNVGDVDFRSGRRGIHVKHGKRDGFRWIPISRSNALYMRIYLSFLKEQGLAEPHMPLFPREDGVRLSGNRVHKMIRERGLDVGVRAFPHAKRHGYVTEMVEAGAPLAVVKELAGHAHINQTAEYTHLSFEHTKKEIDKLKQEYA